MLIYLVVIFLIASWIEIIFEMGLPPTREEYEEYINSEYSKDYKIDDNK